MERTRRRLFTFAITAGALLVILAAAASGLFQLAVQAVPGYRDDVERYVGDLTGRPIRIDALGLTWRYYYPSLELVGVALLSEEGGTPVIEAERLRLGFALGRLVRGDYAPNRLELHGLSLDARIAPDGSLSVQDLPVGGDEGSTEALRPLTRFSSIRLERCRLNLRDDRRGRDTLSFGLTQARFDSGLLGHRVRAEIVLPPVLGETARLDAGFEGDLLAPAEWSGTAELELEGLVPATWAAPYLVRGTTLEAEGVRLRLGAEFEGRRVDSIEARLRSGPVRAARARHEAALGALDVRARIERRDDGWQARVEPLTVAGAHGAWAPSTAEVRATEADGEPTAWEARVGYLQLGDLAPWLQLVRAPAAFAGLSQASGEVRDLELRVAGAVDALRYAYRARFENLALPAGAQPAGVSGLRGEVAGDEAGGRAVLQPSAPELELPGRLAVPTVALEELEGEVDWRRIEEGWRVGMPTFRWQLLGTRGSGRLSLVLPQGRGSPEIDLAAQFSAEDVTRVKPLMPRAWGTGLRSWLDRAIVAGRAPAAELVIQGPLEDFPFDERATGTFKLDIQAADVLLAFQPDWPAVEKLAATLKFRGNSLAIEATEGQIGGNPLRSARAGFADFGTAELVVDGSVSGEIARFYEFLSRSPVRDTLAGLLTRTSATGPAAVDVHLEIPVHAARNTRVRGRVQLDGVQLQAGGLPAPIRDIRGVVSFGGPGIAAEKLTGQLYELALEAAIAPRADGGSLLSASFPLAIDAAGAGASSLIPPWIRRYVHGASRWRATLPLGTGEPAAVTLVSELIGIEVRLPEPLAKGIAESRTLALTIGDAPGAAMRLTADYADRLGADLRFVRGAGGLVLDRGTLRAGSGPLIPPSGKGLSLGGSLAELDLRAWWRELQRGGGEGEGAQPVARADLHIGRASWGAYALRDARYEWTAQKGGWTLSLTGAGGMGEVRWRAAEGGLLSARLDQLGLDRLETVGPEDGTPLDPNAMPLLDLDVRRLSVNRSELGRLRLATQRSDAGQALRTLKVEGGSVDLEASGGWRRRAGQSSADLEATLATRDIAGLLGAFGYTPNIDAKAATFVAKLSWAPAASGLEWQQAQGRVRLDFENGQLRAVEPGGAGRVLGLVNFYAIPRRLALNFRDVVGSGLGFDKVQGSFELRDGSAHTEDLEIRGPSLRMDVRGRIGLAARDFDQRITVYPDVSAGVTLGSLLLGGPVAGALALIAQQILDKPLDQVTQLSYRVTGSWDNPQVERAPAPEGAARERPSGSPSQKP
jgi:uncharacterized protein (TIGR02099 family)